MSRVGKKPIAIPNGVKIEQTGRLLKATGPKGTLQVDIHPDIEVTVDAGANQVRLVNPDPENRTLRALHGTMRALVNNILVGVSTGFSREMRIFGTGYNLKVQGTKLVLQVGFCHPIELEIPKSVKVEIKTPATKGNDVPAIFTLSSPDKHELGQFAANIRRVRPPEPYQGKGIRYADEHVIRKEGKAFASGG
jgi:large subunit ribosomal protein L6